MSATSVHLAFLNEKMTFEYMQLAQNTRFGITGSASACYVILFMPVYNNLPEVNMFIVLLGRFLLR